MPKLTLQELTKKNLKRKIELQFGLAKVTITKNGLIKFQNPTASFELQANGKIKINGKELTLKSMNNITLNADQHIHLNTDRSYAKR